MDSVPPEFFRTLVDGLFDGVYFVDRRRAITYWNQGAERLTGYRAEEVIGKRCADNLLCHVDEAGVALCSGACPLSVTIADGEARAGRVYLRHRAGHRIPVNVRVAPIRGADGRTIGAVEIFSDASEHYEASMRAERLEQLALCDPVTGVANRRAAEQRVCEKLAGARHAGGAFGLLMVDVDHFKRVNDEHGHAAGDAVLRAVAETLAHATRTTDLVGRWGGDEFVVLLATADPEAVGRIAERMRALVATAAVSTLTGRVQATISIGGTLARGVDTMESCIARADALAYASKRAGRNRVTIEP